MRFWKALRWVEGLPEYTVEPRRPFGSHCALSPLMNVACGPCPICACGSQVGLRYRSPALLQEHCITAENQSHRYSQLTQDHCESEVQDTEVG